MRDVEEEMEVEAPVSAVYNQWTQFKEFPRFMQGVKRVEQLDDKTLLWEANVGGKDKSWKATIVSQEPDRHIEWRSISGAPNEGRVLFEPRGVGKTLVKLRIRYDPEGVVETVGDAAGAVKTRVKGDLKRFKSFLEERGRETGGWRGEIEAGRRVR